jgi:dihydrolipoamide dehydrogenase
MEHFDVMVIGSGSGMLIASAAVENGMRTAVVESGPMGGTCTNRGCIPSKMLIYPADAATLIRQAKSLGINASINSIDFKNIMNRMHTLVNGDSGTQAQAVEATPTMKWYKSQGEFIDDYTIQTGGETVRADKIFIVSGTRTKIPPIKGLDSTGYLTSDTVLELEAPPKSLIILGGGYIGVEYGHFFSGIGVKTTLIQRPDRLLKGEEPEVSDLLKLELQQRMEIFTGYEAVEVKPNGGEKVVVARNLADGSQKEFAVEALMVAAGRMPNSDWLKPERTA